MGTQGSSIPTRNKQFPPKLLNRPFIDHVFILENAMDHNEETDYI